MPGFVPWMLFRRSLLLAQCVDLDVRLYYAAVQDLVYGCGNVPKTTDESSDTPPIHSAQLVHQSIDTSIQLPAGLQWDPVQMAEVFQEEYVLFGGAVCTLEWMFQTLFTFQSTTLTACRVKTGGAKTGLLSAIWSPISVTNESLTLQPDILHVLHPGSNGHSTLGCCIFSGSVQRLQGKF